MFRLTRSLFFFFNDPATTEIYTLSLHDALPISAVPYAERLRWFEALRDWLEPVERSEEHTSELQSLTNLVCRRLLEKKKTLPLLLLRVAWIRGLSVFAFHWTCPRPVCWRV